MTRSYLVICTNPQYTISALTHKRSARHSERRLICGFNIFPHVYILLLPKYPKHLFRFPLPDSYGFLHASRIVGIVSRPALSCTLADPANAPPAGDGNWRQAGWGNGLRLIINRAMTRARVEWSSGGPMSNTCRTS